MAGDEVKAAKPPGTIFTFYSYKGGVGRSMALANVGMHCYRQGYTTLLVDCDLEAPGLDRYFQSVLPFNAQEALDFPGFCDMLTDYMHMVGRPAAALDEGPPYPPVENYCFDLTGRVQTETRGRLLLLGAGRRGEGEAWRNYAAFVQNFDWRAFYSDWEGGAYLDWLRQRLCAIADVVLIDSRTGVTEIGGVSTQHLADVVVLLCGGNFENVENTARMARSFVGEAVRAARGGRELKVLVVPSRIDKNDGAGHREFLDRLQKGVANLPIPSDCHPEGLQLPYLAPLSYRESLIVGDPELERTSSDLLEGYRKVYMALRAAAPESSALRSRDSSESKAGLPSVFLCMVPEDRSHAVRIRDYLVRHKAAILLNDVDELHVQFREAESHIARADFILVLLSKRSIESAYSDRVVKLAVDLEKTVIPVLLDETSPPLLLSNLLYVVLESDSERGLETLLRAFQPAGRSSTTNWNLGGRKKVYISHAGRDASIAAKISHYLESRGVSTWLHEEKIVPGRDWALMTQQAIDEADAVAVVISDRTGNSTSKFFRNEMSYIGKVGKQIFPLVVQAGAKPPLLLAELDSIDLTPDLEGGVSLLAKRLGVQ